jgi:hypothetical protein
MSIQHIKIMATCRGFGRLWRFGKIFGGLRVFGSDGDAQYLTLVGDAMELNQRRTQARAVTMHIHEFDSMLVV